MRLDSLEAFEAAQAAALPRAFPDGPCISVGLDTCGIGSGALEATQALKRAILRARVDGADRVAIRRVGCFGICAEEPLATVYRPGRSALLFGRFDAGQAERLVEAVAQAEAGEKAPLDRLARKALARIDSWDFLSREAVTLGPGCREAPPWYELPFFRGQRKVVTRNAGLIDPESLADYLAVGGYRALADSLRSGDRDAAIAELERSGLRGRGGAGYPTWRKLSMVAARPEPDKFVVCNADEGDPGAYMNRNELESDPHSVLEGMAIGAWMAGASRGVAYVRAQYPLAAARLRKAVADAREAGLLGERVLGTDFSFDVDVVEGAGSFVCGEETALIASVEGRSGRPSPKPPYPVERGLKGLPTVICNVETWCNLPVVACKGGDWFRRLGDEESGGTKVFSLVGKVKNAGLVEVPMGTPLAAIVYGMGEGSDTKRSVRAVQTGGPSGGCVPADGLHVPVGYESLASLGTIMGSGGIVVLDDDDCMVDFARYFARFALRESCGKCVPCREGLAQIVRLLDGIVAGRGRPSDLDALEELARYVRDASLCGLGKTASNPLLTSLRHFRAEYEEHVLAGRCRAGACEDLFLAPCENSCPLHPNAPGALELLKEGRIEEAFELTLRDIPMPGTLGRACHYERRMRCKRESADEPVCLSESHRYLADTMYKMGREKAVYRAIAKERLPETGRRVSVVGAGPAGLTAAFYLARLGHSVTVYDEHPEAGGGPRWRIPSFRLPNETTKKEIDFIKSLGIRFVFNAKVGRDVPFEAVEAGSDATVVCVGARTDRVLGIPGERSRGVEHANAFLERLNATGKCERPGEDVVVIGDGNAAVDSARAALRLGSRVTVLASRAREDLPADPGEVRDAIEEGVAFVFLAHPLAIESGSAGECVAVRWMRMRPGPPEHSGRRASLPTGEIAELRCDAALVAAGEKVSLDGFAFSDGSAFPTTVAGRVAADRLSLRLGNRPVWAAGDAVLGSSSIAEAMGQAKRAARDVDLFLTEKDRWASLFKPVSYSMDTPAFVRAKPSRPRKLDPRDRRANFMEVSLGFSGDQASREASRCLRCDLRRQAEGKGEADAAGRG
jgi:NADH-quinone oxidoreductase subunit F